MNFKFGEPKSKYKKMNVIDMLPGTVFCNAYHSPEKVQRGDANVGIYMKVGACNIQNYFGYVQAAASGRHRNPERYRFSVQDVEQSFVISLKTGQLCNFAKDGKIVSGWVMNSELILELEKI